MSIIGAIANIAHADKPTITVTGSGIQQGDNNYYVAEISEGGSVIFTVTASGTVPAITDDEKCVCSYDNTKDSPTPDGGLEYTFTKDAGTQSDNGTGSTVTGTVTSPGEYKFKVTQIEQKYQQCISPWTGGVPSKTNTEESDEVTVLAYRTETQTVATVPQNRARKKIGVGEEVNLTLLPASTSADWSVEGENGCVSDESGNQTTYTAHSSATTANVKAQIKGITKTITFTVIAPSSVTVFKTSGTTTSTANSLFVEMHADWYIGPEDVNFYGLAISEGTCGADCSGYFSYQNGLLHTPGDTVYVSNTLVAGKGWKCASTDTISGGTKGPPYLEGTFTWPIPFSYTVSGVTSPKQFVVINHVKSLVVQFVLITPKSTLSLDKTSNSHISVTEP